MSAFLAKSYAKGGFWAGLMPCRTLQSLESQKEQASGLAKLLSSRIKRGLFAAQKFLNVAPGTAERNIADFVVRASNFAIKNNNLELFKQALELLDQHKVSHSEQGAALTQIMGRTKGKLKLAYCQILLDQILSQTEPGRIVMMLRDLFPDIIRLETIKGTRKDGMLQSIADYIENLKHEPGLKDAFIEFMLSRIKTAPGASNSPNIKSFIGRINPAEKKPTKTQRSEPKAKPKPAQPNQTAPAPFKATAARRSRASRLTKSEKIFRALRTALTAACQDHLSDSEIIIEELKGQQTTNTRNLTKNLFEIINGSEETIDSITSLAKAIVGYAITLSNKRDAENILNGLLDGILLLDQPRSIIKAIEPTIIEKFGDKGKLQQRIEDAYEQLKPRTTAQVRNSGLSAMVGMQVFTARTAPSKGPRTQAKEEVAAEPGEKLLKEIVEEISTLINSGTFKHETSTAILPKCKQLQEEKELNPSETAELIISTAIQENRNLTKHKIPLIVLARIIADLGLKEGKELVDDIINKVAPREEEPRPAYRTIW